MTTLCIYDGVEGAILDSFHDNSRQSIFKTAAQLIERVLQVEGPGVDSSGWLP